MTNIENEFIYNGADILGLVEHDKKFYIVKEVIEREKYVGYVPIIIEESTKNPIEYQEGIGYQLGLSNQISKNNDIYHFHDCTSITKTPCKVAVITDTPKTSCEDKIDHIIYRELGNVTRDEEGVIYISFLSSDDVIISISPSGEFKPFYEKKNTSIDISYGNGFIWAANKTDDTIMKISKEGIDTVMLKGIQNLSGICFDPYCGDVYYFSDDDIMSFNPDTKVVKKITERACFRGYNAHFMAVDFSGIFVSDM